MWQAVSHASVSFLPLYVPIFSLPEKVKEKGFPLQSCAVIQRITLRYPLPSLPPIFTFLLLSCGEGIKGRGDKKSPEHFCSGLLFRLITIAYSLINNGTERLARCSIACRIMTYYYPPCFYT